MTIEEFRATKREATQAELVQYTNAGEGETAARGLVYLDVLVIESTEGWDNNASKHGKYYLLIANCEWISDSLAELEERLYQWAMSEGYGDK